MNSDSKSTINFFMFCCYTWFSKKTKIFTMRTPAAKQPEMTTQIAKQMAGPRPFMIGVAGGSAAGKKEVCEMILSKLQLVNKHCLKCVHIR
jgi:pantothenate kinase